MKIKQNIINQKLELIQWLSAIENKETIEKLIELRNKEKEDWWNTIDKEEKQSINNGLKDAEQEKLKPHAKAKKIYGKWL